MNTSYDNSKRGNIIISVRKDGLGLFAKHSEFNYQFYLLLNIQDEFSKLLAYCDKAGFIHIGGISPRYVQGLNEKYSFLRGTDVGELNLSRVQMLISLFINLRTYSSDEDIQIILEILSYLNRIEDIISEDYQILKNLRFPHYLFKGICNELNSLRKIKDESQKDEEVSRILLAIRNNLFSIVNSVV